MSHPEVDMSHPEVDMSHHEVDMSHHEVDMSQGITIIWVRERDMVWGRDWVRGRD